MDLVKKKGSNYMKLLTEKCFEISHTQEKLERKLEKPERFYKVAEKSTKMRVSNPRSG